MKKLFILLCLCLVVGSARAKVTLPAIFTDNMVLQQKTQVTLYGKAAAGKKMTVTTEWDHEQYRFHSDAEGNWSVRIPTPEAGGPFDITISDGKKITLRNILIGEVWFCSGQSNMEMPVAGWGKVLNYEQEVAAADYPCIRLFQVKKATSLAPAADVASTMGGWQECSPASVPEFSALGYFFARRLWQELGIPVGVIDCTWGGTPAEAWTSYN
ncbi:sialate O-acetylesterase, partial [Gabonia massiliensis]|uniref:sialate O-acetylesterase n=1 Tax=Gabonia massiliensis TaxID=1686296 RepID=UPI00294FF4AB